MKRRLLIPLLSLITVVLLALGLPLAAGQARAAAGELFLDRISDAARFASIASQTSSDADPRLLEAELRQYRDVYDISAAMLDRDGRVVVASNPGFVIPDAARGEWMQVVLGGRRPGPPAAIWPWDDEPLVVAEPVVSGGDVIGAIVTSSPVTKSRQSVGRQWLALGMVMAAALAVGLLLAVALTRWVLRPVRLLDGLAHDIATGRLSTRVPGEQGPVELRRLSASINEMADAVGSLVRRQRAFVADASHQLRNQLHALLLRLDGVTMTVPPDCRQDAELAAEEGRRLTRMLDRLLELAGAERAGSPGPGQVDLATLARDRVVAWQAAAGARGIGLSLAVPPAAPVAGQEIAVSGALDALLDNAIKYSPEGTTVAVRVVAVDDHPDGDRALLEVIDSGAGLPADEWAHVGDRFWRSRHHQNIEGTGLGLSIARALLHSCGGRLDVGPDPHGTGVLARIGLPAIPPVSDRGLTTVSSPGTNCGHRDAVAADRS